MSHPIAITGLACRFPGADAIPQFLELLRSGRDAISDPPVARRRLLDRHPVTTLRGGYLGGVDLFDPGFFGISGREAADLDPQHRLALEVTWRALEDAGLTIDQLRGSRTGVYLGMGQTDYQRLLLDDRRADRISAWAGTGTHSAAAAGRISFWLGLEGPSLAVDTACSSSLTALHLAVNALRRGECNAAITGGVHLNLAPEPYVFLSQARALAPDGHSKTFDASADGYGRGEGCGILILKRLDDAQAAGDTIWAVIRGTAVNHDGPSSGFTVPNGLAQRRLLEAALADAATPAASIQYVEAHGTGTLIGDPIEVEAIGEVYGPGREAPLYLGSVKAAIGHLEAAAGVAGVIKAVLALRHGFLPAQPHFTQPNPRIPWRKYPVAVTAASRDWPQTNEPRRAAVSAFGMSGSNAHVVLEQPPASPVDANVPSPYRLILSARTEAALAETIEAYRHRLSSADEFETARICATAATRRTRFDVRAAAEGATRDELLRSLADPARITDPPIPAAYHTLPPVPVPGHPFDRRAFWASGASTALWDQTVTSPLIGGTLYTTNTSRERAALEDHRVNGAIVVPAAFHLALAAAATARSLENIVFPQALTLSDDTSLHLLIETSGAVRIASPAATHLEATTAPAHPATPIALNEIRRRCRTHVPATEIYNQLERRGITLGPAFRCCEEAWAAGDEALGHLRPGSFRAGVIDACLQLITLLLDESGQAEVPGRLRAFRLHADSLDSAAWCHVAKRTQGFDIRLTDAAGIVLLEIDGAVLKPIAQPAFTYRLAWHAVEPAATADATCHIEVIETGDQPSPEAVLDLARLAATLDNRRLTVAARGAGAIALGGLVRTLAIESPELSPVFIELDPTPVTNDELARLPGPGWYRRRNGQWEAASLEPAAPPPPATANGHYLITGGAGALGRHIADALLERGAASITLASRTQPGPLSEAIHWRPCDVTDPAQVEALLAALPEVTGIVHAAAALRDQAALHLSDPAVHDAMGAKALGAWNLHQATLHRPLEFLIFVSSTAALLGSPGQAAYASANAYLDALAALRHQMGLPATVIHYGPWQGAGMAGSLSASARQAWQRRGITPLDPATALRAFSPQPAIAIHANWPQLAQMWSHTPTYLARLVPDRTPPQTGNPPLPQLVRELTAAVLGLDRPLPATAGFFDAGMDSLMAVELRNTLQTRLGIPLPATLLFDYSNLEALTEYLAERLTPASRGLEELSEAELEKLLADKLDSLEETLTR